MRAFVSVVILLILVGLIGAGIFFLIKRRKRHRKTDLSDQLSMKRTSINTEFLERHFQQTIYYLIFSEFTLNPQTVPVRDMMPDLGKRWTDQIYRKHQLQIHQNVHAFELQSTRVVKQDNSSIYAVSSISVEATFRIVYEYHHATQKNTYDEVFKQRFVFINTNQDWRLSEIEKRDIASRQTLS